MITTLISLLAIALQIDARAVNISNTWILPQEGFPVFYRYFRDRISWYEADAVCQFHHANLVTVDTTSQYDAARAYLKELDIMSNVWIGLIKSNEEGDFSWTDYKPLSGEGYWGAAPGDSRAPLCVALDPAHDYRWTALSCGGPQVASFICELPVPVWATNENGGCLVRSLPSLTVQYLPELAAVRLASDCGLDGTRSVTCKANEEHKDILKELSCFIIDDDFSDNTITTLTDNGISSGSTSHHTGSWTFNPTVSTTGDLISSTRLRRETPATTPLSVDTTTVTVGSFQNTIKHVQSGTTADEKLTSTNTMPSSLNPILARTNAQTLPPIAYVTSGLSTTTKKSEISHVSENPTKASLDYTEQPTGVNKVKSTNIATKTNTPETKIQTEHPIISAPIMENTEQIKHQKEHIDIFTQATDHFIPPLVMAKSKLSTDMELVSPESKQHKQISHIQKHKNQHTDITMSPVTTEKIDNIQISTESKLDNEIKKTTMLPFIQRGNNFINEEIVTEANKNLKVENETSTDKKIEENKLKNIKYKTNVNTKKYDKEKEEKKKYKDINVKHKNVTTEVKNKVVQVTIGNFMGKNKNTVIDVTTRLPNIEENNAKSTLQTMTTKNLEKQMHMDEVTKSLIDPNIIKLNRNNEINNESESIHQDSIDKSTVTSSNASSNTNVNIKINESVTQPISNIDNKPIAVTEHSTDQSPEPIPRPNRSRLLTHPAQHRSFYPYFFNRVLG